MTTIREAVRRMFAPPQPLPAGTYPYQAPPDAPFPYRLHLRIETDGSGVLILNASTVLHLNQTAAEYAYHLIKQTPEEQIARLTAGRYKVNRAKALQDYRDFVQRIQTLIDTPDLDPTTYLGFERAEPYTAVLTAPYRLDCAITYRLAPGTPAEAAPTDRVKRELGTDEWLSILDKAMEAGIPHLVFTGGEPTLREDLFELLNHAEARGQVTGLISDGLRLAEPEYLNALLQTGLDHLMMVFNPSLDTAWQALRAVIAADLFTAVHLTVTGKNLEEIPAVLDRLAQEGIQNISLSAADSIAAPHLQNLRDSSAAKGLTLVWDLPVPYSTANPINLELAGEAEQLPEGAGHAWLYVEPDGDVLPAQQVNRVLGNMMTDTWNEIWNRR